MKKVLIGVMSFLMLLSSAISVYATDENNSDQSFTVNGKNFVTFAEAFEDACEKSTEDGTYKLIHDITGEVTSETGFTGYTVKEGENLTLDLNGHNIVIEDKVPSTKTFVLFQNKGAITIEDSSGGDGFVKIHNNKSIDYSNATVIIRSQVWTSTDNQVLTAVNINGGTLSVESEDADGKANMCYVIDALDGATVNINGGTLQSDYHVIRLYVQTGFGDAVLNMSDGTLKQGEGRYMPVLFAQYGPSEEKQYAIDINVTGGKLYNPNGSLIYYGWEYPKMLNASFSGCVISSQGIIDDHYYDIEEDESQIFYFTNVEIKNDVVVDQDYVRKDIDAEDLIEPNLGGIQLTNESGTKLMLSTKETYKYGDGEDEWCYYDDLYFVFDEEDAPNPTSPAVGNNHSSPSKDLPSNTEECQKEFGKDYIYSKDLDACIIKYLVVDTSTK